MSTTQAQVKGAHNRAITEVLAGRDPVAERERARDLAALLESELAEAEEELGELKGEFGICLHPRCRSRDVSPGSGRCRRHHGAEHTAAVP